MSFVTHLLGTLNNIKTYHWQTHSYAHHIVIDKLYKILEKQIDTFVEVYSGEHNDRPFFTDDDVIKVNNLKDEDARDMLHHFAKWLATDLKNVADNSISLNHIIEEMSSAVQQTLYLLSFF